MIHLRPDRLYTDRTVNSKGEIQSCRSDRKHFYIALRRIYINFFSNETWFEIMKKIDAVCLLAADHLTDLVKPFIKAAFIGGFFLVFPVGSQSLFSNLVHSFRSYLHFHPFTLWSHHCSMQRFIPV